MLNYEIPFEWERLHVNDRDYNWYEETDRAKVFGGWIVRSQKSLEDRLCESMVFIPDPKHLWKIKE
jgi:hypothetical protein